jgi:hypothetical protein
VRIIRWLDVDRVPAVSERVVSRNSRLLELATRVVDAAAELDPLAQRAVELLLTSAYDMALSARRARDEPRRRPR